MLTYKQPVFFSGENPGFTLYAPESDAVVAIVSYWNCTYSAQGSGWALVVWAKTGISPFHAQPGHIWTNNPPLAMMLRDTLTQYFPEFKGCQAGHFPIHEAEGVLVNDGRQSYQVYCQAAGVKIAAAWLNPMACRQLSWPGLPAGPHQFDLSNVLLPCAAASLTINDQPVNGFPKTGAHNGMPVSSAFLALAETWIGPLPLASDPS